MSGYFEYLLISSITLSVLLGAYYFLFRKETDFKLIRFFLLFSMFFSLLLPFNPVSINFPTSEQDKSNKLTEIQSFKTDTPNSGELIQHAANEELIEANLENPTQNRNWLELIIIVYFVISAFIITRMLFSIAKVFFYYYNAEKINKYGYTLVVIKKNIIPFTFFNWIFINESVLKENHQQIIEHEKVHAHQYHTIDLLLSELLVAAMWFNPFIWVFKKALQQVHEFLADEGVLNSGYNKLEYQSLLVNQVAEERLVAVSSNFSYSLIKKRIIMMSKTKTDSGVKLKLMVLIPLISFLLIGMSCANGQEPENEYIAAVSPTKMNILYIGVDNPVSIAVTGADYGKVVAEIDNGKISGENGNYMVRVKKPGVVTISVKVGDDVVSDHKFRVKQVPDPVAIVKGNWGKTVLSKQELLDAGGIEVLLANFDFALKFNVVSFRIATTMEGFELEARANDNKFSKGQIDLIQKMEKGQKFYIEDIKAKGPDGSIRNLGALSIRIK